MLNTFMGHHMEEFLSTNPNNTREKPATVLVYNATMGALDHVDQMIKPYSTARKSLKWYKKVAFNLIDMTVYNSYVLYCEFKTGKEKPTYKAFIRTIIREILDKYPPVKPIIGRPSTDPLPNRKVGTHLPAKVTKTDGSSSFSNCHFCTLKGIRKGTAFKCLTCQKRFCVQGESSCFFQYHTLSQLPQKNWSVLPKAIICKVREVCIKLYFIMWSASLISVYFGKYVFNVLFLGKYLFIKVSASD